MGPLELSQATLVLAALIMIIPAVMIVLSLLLPARVNRPLNLVLAIAHPHQHQQSRRRGMRVLRPFGIAEITIIVYIFLTAWRLPRREVTE
jgi:hypothetical protein